ncbi:unnamed protein product [Ranitomeya imitator]|uniref:Phosphoribosyltransferase domain-containing protein n=1 Tax=Ranitomeya imitator TaxID=111125 RepID=A0ABN9L480_9NEOB|nr:unnamed protein product [Ranitomeya imitator]
MAVWRRHPSNIRDLEQFAKEEWSKIPAEHCKKLIDGYRKRLPKDISEDHVILMDCTVSTGAAAMMAVRVLLDHEVPEDKIFLLSLLMAELGVHSVAYAFPHVRILTTAVDKKVNDMFRIIPGIGNFGDRYFGTDAPADWSDEDDPA